MPVRQHGTQAGCWGDTSLIQVQLCVHHAAKVGQPAKAAPAPLRAQTEGGVYYTSPTAGRGIELPKALVARVPAQVHPYSQHATRKRVHVCLLRAAEVHAYCVLGPLLRIRCTAVQANTGWHCHHIEGGGRSGGSSRLAVSRNTQSPWYPQWYALRAACLGSHPEWTWCSVHRRLHGNVANGLHCLRDVESGSSDASGSHASHVLGDTGHGGCPVYNCLGKRHQSGTEVPSTHQQPAVVLVFAPTWARGGAKKA